VGRIVQGLVGAILTAILTFLLVRAIADPIPAFFASIGAAIGVVPAGFLILYAVEFVIAARQVDRGVLRLVSAAATILVLCGLSGWEGWYISNISNTLVMYERVFFAFKAELAKQRALGATIADLVSRLLQTYRGRDDFDKAVSDAENSWRRLEAAKNTLVMVSSQPTTKDMSITAWYRQAAEWQTYLDTISNIVTKTVGQGQPLWGHTANYDPARKVEGEDGIDDEESQRRWREAIDAHLFSVKAIADARNRFNVTILSLHQELAKAAHDIATAR
jgi:hypothetical protein